MTGVHITLVRGGWPKDANSSVLTLFLQPILPELACYHWWSPFRGSASVIRYDQAESAGVSEVEISSMSVPLNRGAGFNLFRPGLVARLSAFLSTDFLFLAGLRGEEENLRSELLSSEKPGQALSSASSGILRNEEGKALKKTIEGAEVIIACYDDLWIAFLARDPRMVESVTVGLEATLASLGSPDVEPCDLSLIENSLLGL